MFAIYNLHLLLAKYLTSVVAALMQLISQIKFRMCNKVGKKKLGKLFSVQRKTWKAFSINNTTFANCYFYSSSYYFFISKYF